MASHTPFCRALIPTICIAVAAWPLAVVQAAPYTWAGGSSGTWSNGGAGWLTTAGAANWANANEAIFGGASPTSVVVAAGGVSVSGSNPALSIASGNYIFSGGTISIGSNARVTVAPGSSASFANPLNGSSGSGYYNGTITTSGGISQGGTNLFFGNDAASAITQNGGTVQVTTALRDITIGSTTAYTLNDGVLRSTRDLFISGTLAAAGGTIDAPRESRIGTNARLAISGAAVRVAQLGNANITGSAAIRFSSGTLQPYDGQGLKIARRNSANPLTFTLDGSNGVISSSDRTGAASFVAIGGTASIWGNSDGSAIPITETGGSRSLTFTGLGTTILSGSNTYTGTTLISSGTLSLASTARLNATSAISVAAGATYDVSNIAGYTIGANQLLTGGGIVLGAVSVSGTVSPGASPGVLTFDSLLLQSTAQTLIEIESAGTRGLNYDGIDILDENGLQYGGTLAFMFGPSAISGGDFTIFSFSGAPTGGFTSVQSTGFYDAPWTSLGTGAWQSNKNGQTLTFTESTGVLVITVPEPSALALAALGILLMNGFISAAGRRRRHAP